MSIALEQFKKTQEVFDVERNKDEGSKTMLKVIALVNELGANFSKIDGGELSDIQIKLAGYKFYLAVYVADLQRYSEALKIEIKETTAKRWDEISEVLIETKGKVKNKEEIQNVITMETKKMCNEQILYEGMYYKYKMKLYAVDDILTALVQRIAELKKQVEQAKAMQ